MELERLKAVAELALKKKQLEEECMRLEKDRADSLAEHEAREKALELAKRLELKERLIKEKEERDRLEHEEKVQAAKLAAVSYTHLTLPTKLEV